MSRHDPTRVARFLEERPGKPYTAAMLHRILKRSEPSIRQQLYRLLATRKVQRTTTKVPHLYWWVEQEAA